MELILLIFFLSLFTYVSLRSRLWGLAIIIAALPTYLWRFSFILPTTFLELMIIVLFIVWLIKDKKYQIHSLFRTLDTTNKLSRLWKILLGCWMLVSVGALAANPELAALGIWRAYFLEPLLLFLVMIDVVKDSQDLRVIVNALAVLVLCLFIFTVAQYLTSWNLPPEYNWPSQRRLTGIFDYPNALALLIAPLGSFFGALWIQTKKKKQNWHYLFVFAAAALCCVLAVSQGALVGIAASMLIWLILARNVRRFALPIIVLVLIGGLFFAPARTVFLDLQQQIAEPVLDLSATSLEIRSNQWSETMLFLTDHWLFGAGMAGYQAAIAPYHSVGWLEIYLYPHNIFLNFWTELGLLGLLVLLGMIFYIMIKTVALIRKENILGWPLLMFWTTWLIHGLVDVPYFKNDLSILFFVGLGITILADLAIERNASI